MLPCLYCGNISHEYKQCPDADRFIEIHRMADLAGYYIELATLNFKNEIRITWRHNSYNPKNFCSGEAFLQMCRDTIEYRNRKQ